MKIIISPAKKLSDKCTERDFNFSKIKFENKAENLVNMLKGYKVSDLSKLMSISENLSEINSNRFKNWRIPFNGNSDYAVFMFQGDVYKGLDVKSLSDSEINYAQDNLRILSGLYGILKPLDRILPYRLEMGTKLKTDYGKNLYDYWGDSISDFLISEISSSENLVNLASDEYSKAVKLNKFENNVITPKFLDEKNGKLKMISFYAKKARGLMARHIIQTKAQTVEDLYSFNLEGYNYSEINSTDDCPTFVRVH
tara:strand:+ start:27696 stop:28457 length:762 start_codon:yes stop_codon:yes gene_type:complete